MAGRAAGAGRPGGVPHGRSWWVDEHLMAGDYAGARDPQEAEAKVQGLLDAGVTLFLDLTTDADRLEPYAHLVAAAEERGARRVAVPVPDMTAPSREDVERCLRLIDEEQARGGVTYVHCWGGIGRTGAIIGCYLARDLGGEAALRRLRELRIRSGDSHRTAPEMPDQVALVRSWPRRDSGS